MTSPLLAARSDVGPSQTQFALQPRGEPLQQISLEGNERATDFNHAGANWARASAFHVVQQTSEIGAQSVCEAVFALDVRQGDFRVVMREIDFYLRLVIDEDRLRRLAQGVQELLAAFLSDRINLARALTAALSPHRDHLILFEPF